MGILEAVHSDHAGIIPRSLGQIFDHIHCNRDRAQVTVTLSFLQLYRESLQDLLAPLAAEIAITSTSTAASSAGGNSSSGGGKFSQLGGGSSSFQRDNDGANPNLIIREDPVRGIYVEGLQEFIVSSYTEAGKHCWHIG
jgi:hypothetical protein